MSSETVVPKRSGAVRWDRVFLTTSLLLLGLLIFQWRDARPPRVSFEAGLWAPMEWTLERTGSLAHPPPAGDASVFMTLRGREERVAANLPPGHYRLSLQPEEAGEPLTLPILVTSETGKIAWELGVKPPAGFVPIPPGTFVRGPGGPVASTERLLFAALHEATRAEWHAFLKALKDRPELRARVTSEAERIAFPEGGVTYEARESWAGRPVADDPRLPVNGVSWYAAQAFARWYTEEHGGGRFTFRLPTRLEWEKMARGTDGRLYPWGNDARHDVGREREERPLLPVDARPERRSPYGLFQTFGNVSEWGADATDPLGLHRVVLGPSASGVACLLDMELGDARAAQQRPDETGLRLVAEADGRGN